MIKNLKNILAVVIELSLLITLMNLEGCGFKLRAQNVLPPNFYYLNIQSAQPYGDFESLLRRTLMGLGVCVTRSQCAPFTLHILNKALFHDVPSIGGSNQARVYNYYYQVMFEVQDQSGRCLLPAQSVKASETLIVNPGTALESTNQLEIVKQELQVETIHMIINILNSPQMFCASSS